MKLKAIIREDVKASNKTIIVKFEGDEKSNILKCLFSPFYLEMKKLDLCLLNIKIESEIYTEPKIGEKSYFTHLPFKKAELINSPHVKDKGWRTLG